MIVSTEELWKRRRQNVNTWVNYLSVSERHSDRSGQRLMRWSLSLTARTDTSFYWRSVLINSLYYHRLCTATLAVSIRCRVYVMSVYLTEIVNSLYCRRLSTVALAVNIRCKVYISSIIRYISLVLSNCSSSQFDDIIGLVLSWLKALCKIWSCKLRDI